MKTAILMLLLAVDGGVPDHQHCWHYSNWQHAVPCHSDEVCCFCGKSKCGHTPGCSIGPPPGHGQYAPGGGVVLQAGESICFQPGGCVSNSGPTWIDAGTWLQPDGGPLVFIKSAP